MYKLNTIPIKVQTIHFMELDTLLLKFIQENKHITMARKTLTKKKTTSDD